VTKDAEPEKNNTARPTRRLLTRFAIGALVLSLILAITGWAVFRFTNVTDMLMRSTVKNLALSQRNDLFTDGQIHVIILGTGSPQPGSDRLPAANAVIAGDEFIIVDAGEGASRTMSALRLPTQRISTVLLTHLHSDHIGGLGQVLNESWNAGRPHELTVYGPVGSQFILDGLALQYQADIDYRSSGHVEEHDPTLALANAEELDVAPEDGLVRVFERNGVTVDVFHVDHGHVVPAFGYRIEYQGRSVVFSGDTAATPLMVDAAKNADVLIHEAMNMRMMRNAAQALGEIDMPDVANQAAAIMGYHTDTLELAKIASDANVSKLVLTHLIPAPPNVIAARMFKSGMGQHYSGPIIVAEDRMMLSW
jgi:ribonuclease Z